MPSDKSIIKELFPSARIIRLEENTEIKPFNCEDSDFEDFLFKDAKRHLKYLRNVTYLLETEDRTIAYYTIANDLLRVNQSLNREFKTNLRAEVTDTFVYDLFNETTFPAVKIGVLAVDKEFQCKGVGSELLDLIIFSFIDPVKKNKTGCMFITVDAVKASIGFYEKKNFLFLSETDQSKDSRQMYTSLLRFIS